MEVDAEGRLVSSVELKQRHRLHLQKSQQHRALDARLPPHQLLGPILIALKRY